MLKDKMRRVNCIHFVGIGGAGMGGIAEVLAKLNYTVQGSDLRQSDMTRHLTQQGVKVFIGHASEHVKKADVVVVSSAIDGQNPEIIYAQEQRIPIIKRAQMLAELMRFRFGIAVAGTHGKTTTTSMLATLYCAAGLDPTYVIGGKLNSAGHNAKLGESKYLIAEADESDASFLHLLPTIAVITNIEADHLDAYAGDFSLMKKAYLDFLHNLPFYGLAVLCGDDANVRELIPNLARKYITYGLHADNDYQLVDIGYQAKQTVFTLRRPAPHQAIRVILPQPGVHNALNAAAAIAVATDQGIDEQEICAAMASFAGIGRRFQILGNFSSEQNNLTLVDDYGHHPTEVMMTIKAARQSFPSRRLVMVYQPHRFSRTRDLYDEFVEVLSQVDVLVLIDIYSAGETPISNVSSKSLSASIRQRGKIDPLYASSRAHLFQILADLLQHQDVLLTQGAGSIGEIATILSTAQLARGRLLELSRENP